MAQEQKRRGVAPGDEGLLRFIEDKQAGKHNPVYRGEAEPGLFDSLITMKRYNMLKNMLQQGLDPFNPKWATHQWVKGIPSGLASEQEREQYRRQQLEQKNRQPTHNFRRG